jgi:hypothetical protein
MPHSVRPRLKRGDDKPADWQVARVAPLVNYTVTIEYAQSHMTVTNKSMARDWTGALDLALRDRLRDPNFNPEIVPAWIKIERR